jgi:lysophospholipid acyltransferase (LPLAT)-like uncharacterized protein
MAKPIAKRVKESLLIGLSPLPAALFVKLLHRSLNIRFVNRSIPEGVKGRGGQYIMAFWHGCLLLMVYAYVGSRLTFLVSWHRDGELITMVMKRFGMNPTRGSTTRGGIRALHSLLKKVKEGYDIAFTPDGPRGPARMAQLGVVQTARLSGLPVIPVGMAALKKKRCVPGTASSSRGPSPAWSSPMANPSRCPGSLMTKALRPCA